MQGGIHINEFNYDNLDYLIIDIFKKIASNVTYVNLIGFNPSKKKIKCLDPTEGHEYFFP